MSATLAAFAFVGIVSWHDGDSGRHGRQRIRLAAVDAPELAGSPRCRRGNVQKMHIARACDPLARRYATAARDRLRQLTIGGVECRGAETDIYERAVVTCRLPDGRDPAAVLVREGLARADVRYGRRYVRDEALARVRRVGVWGR